MKVFISWSGAASKQVAEALRHWLPLVIQSIEPYMSAKDISVGSRWSTEVGGELEVANFGILCLTRSNTDAPWLNFEAGALSKSMKDGRVMPYLFQLEPTDLSRRSPLVQFQAVRANRDDTFKLVTDLNAASEHPLVEQQLVETFDMAWPKLERLLSGVPDEESNGNLPERTEHDLLVELLELARGQQKILSDPRAVLPPNYLRTAVGGGFRWSRLQREIGGAVSELVHQYGYLLERLPDDAAPELQHAVEALRAPLLSLVRRTAVVDDLDQPAYWARPLDGLETIPVIDLSGSGMGAGRSWTETNPPFKRRAEDPDSSTD